MSNTLIYQSLALVVLGLFIIQRVVSYLLLKKRPCILVTLIGVLLLILTAVANSVLPIFSVLMLDLSLVFALDIMWNDFKLGIGVVSVILILALVLHVIWVLHKRFEAVMMLVIAVAAPLVRVGPYMLRVTLKLLMVKDKFGSVFAMQISDFKPTSWLRFISAVLCLLISCIARVPGIWISACLCLLMLAMVALDLVDSYCFDRRSKGKADDKILPNVKQEELYQNMIVLFKKDKIFLDPDFSLLMLAERLGTNQSYVSCMLNSYLHMTFPRLRNALRIEYAVSVVNEDPSIKVEPLSLQCGYGTLVTFEREFKKRVGLSPSDYIKGMRAMRALGHSPSPSMSQGLELPSELPFSLRDE